MAFQQHRHGTISLKAIKQVFDGSNPADMDSFKSRYALLQTAKNEELQVEADRGAEATRYSIGTKSDCLYVVTSGLHGDEPNENGDFFPWTELLAKKAGRYMFESWIGCPVCLNHDMTKRVGTILDAIPVRDEKSIDFLLEIEHKLAPHAVNGIRRGDIVGTSMGVMVGRSICSICGNIAENEQEWCKAHLSPHGGNLKGKIYLGQDGMKYKNKLGQKVHEINLDLEGVEDSIITLGQPADPHANIKTVLASQNEIITLGASTDLNVPTLASQNSNEEGDTVAKANEKTVTERFAGSAGGGGAVGINQGALQSQIADLIRPKGRATTATEVKPTYEDAAAVVAAIQAGTLAKYAVIEHAERLGVINASQAESMSPVQVFTLMEREAQAEADVMSGAAHSEGKNPKERDPSKIADETTNKAKHEDKKPAAHDNKRLDETDADVSTRADESTNKAKREDKKPEADGSPKDAQFPSHDPASVAKDTTNKAKTDAAKKVRGNSALLSGAANALMTVDPRFLSMMEIKKALMESAQKMVSAGQMDQEQFKDFSEELTTQPLVAKTVSQQVLNLMHQSGYGKVSQTPNGGIQSKGQAGCGIDNSMIPTTPHGAEESDVNSAKPEETKPEARKNTDLKDGKTEQHGGQAISESDTSREAKKRKQAQMDDMGGMAGDMPGSSAHAAPDMSHSDMPPAMDAAPMAPVSPDASQMSPDEAAKVAADLIQSLVALIPALNGGAPAAPEMGAPTPDEAKSEAKPPINKPGGEKSEDKSEDKKEDKSEDKKEDKPDHMEKKEGDDDGMSYSAKLVVDKKSPEDSFYTVALKNKPLFSISLAQAFGAEAKAEKDNFVSAEYKEELVSTLNQYGAREVFNKLFPKGTVIAQMHGADGNGATPNAPAALPTDTLPKEAPAGPALASPDAQSDMMDQDQTKSDLEDSLLDFLVVNITADGNTDADTVAKEIATTVAGPSAEADPKFLAKLQQLVQQKTTEKAVDSAPDMHKGDAASDMATGGGVTPAVPEKSAPGGMPTMSKLLQERKTDKTVIAKFSQLIPILAKRVQAIVAERDAATKKIGEFEHTAKLKARTVVTSKVADLKASLGLIKPHEAKAEALRLAKLTEAELAIEQKIVETASKVAENVREASKSDYLEGRTVLASIPSPRQEVAQKDSNSLPFTRRAKVQ